MSDVPAFRDFDAEIAEDAGVPVTFKLGGKTFQCIHPMPLGTVLVTAKNALNKPDDLKSQAEQVNLLWSFVVPEQHDDLDTVISHLTDPTVITKIFEYFMTESTNRFTQGS